MENVRGKLRVFVEQPLGGEKRLTIAGGAAHYLRNVMRAGAGEPVRLFNGADGEWLARIEAMSRDACELCLLQRLRAQTPEPGPCLLFAPLKKDAIDFIAMKATELGAARLMPVQTEFTAVARINADRLRQQAIQAAEQCGRLTVPVIAPLRPLPAVLADWQQTTSLYICHPSAEARPMAAVFAETRRSGGDPASPGLLIGPEGGFSEMELDRLNGFAFATTLAMGPRILRAETAALAALACWQALAGDWEPRSDQHARENQRSQDAGRR